MNIAVDIRALSNKKLTGIGKYIFYALEHILENDKKNKYYLFSSGRKPLSKEQLPSAGNFEYIHIKVPNKVLNFALWANWLKLDKLLPAQIDLFWLPNLNFARFSQGVDYVLTVHDLSFLHSREFYSLKRRWWHKLIDVSYLLTRARQVIAVSYNTKRDILRFFPLDEKKIKIINPGIYSQVIEESRVREILAQYGIDKKYFLYLGTLEPRKNILSIIKAFGRFHRDYPDYQLLIVGSKGWIYHPLLRLIKKKDYVRYLGYVDGEQKDALYSLCQAFIWPSFYEGYSFPPLEALAHSKPLIVSYKTSLPETLKTAAIYVDPYNIADIYQAMISLEKDQLLVQELRQRAQKFVLPSWKSQSHEIVDCLITKTIPK